MTQAYSVVVSDYYNPTNDIDRWCEEQFGQPALIWEPVSLRYKWTAIIICSESKKEDEVIYYFYYEDDATLFRLTWT